jgi:hypothetical protein
LSSVDGLLAVTTNNNADSYQQWRFTLLSTISSTSAVYTIQNPSTASTVWAIDSSNSDLVNGPNNSDSTSQQWTVSLTSNASVWGNPATFTIAGVASSNDYLTFVKTSSFGLLTESFYADNITQWFSFVSV